MPDSEPRVLPRPPLLAHGGAGVLTTALATLLVLLMLAVLLWVVAANAAVWFWPAPVWELELADGSRVVGEIVRREPARDGGLGPLLLKVGNRELGGDDHLAVDEAAIIVRRRPQDAVAIERSVGGEALGRFLSCRSLEGEAVPPGDDQALAAALAAAAAERRALRRERARHARVRRPLTEAEHAFERLRRSSAADAHDLADAERAAATLREQLRPRLETLEAAIRERERRLAGAAVILDTGAVSLEVGMATVERLTWSNRLGPLQRALHAAGSALRFLFSAPREANTEGGVFPALFGTVLMVLLMSVAVMPLGVLAAVYLHEYAGDGPLQWVADRAIHNLAGVPSIVFGMFGLAFFVYGVGGAVDRSLFADELPSPTFGTGGILWASLTLAVLTIPVVVVATREGLQAVPSSWREGARALGANRLQTLLQIVLPAALPGILTGLILAISRAAGEVAPLMLTGAVKLAPALPVDGEPPFLHLHRKFMHLSFHVYDVSMQSPNIEAAKPMAFASTLLLLVLVVVVNLTAILVRRRVRAAYRVLEG
ncbi:MAG: phosphate ABC transporter permease PstA [Thermoanaerobaculales bacterium]|nr:phosphate ABC transporter permease PstA [Thermoanaerobaculales bacterium]